MIFEQNVLCHDGALFHKLNVRQQALSPSNGNRGNPLGRSDRMTALYVCPGNLS